MPADCFNSPQTSSILHFSTSKYSLRCGYHTFFMTPQMYGSISPQKLIWQLVDHLITPSPDITWICPRILLLQTIFVLGKLEIVSRTFMVTFVSSWELFRSYSSPKYIVLQCCDHFGGMLKQIESKSKIFLQQHSTSFYDHQYPNLSAAQLPSHLR